MITLEKKDDNQKQMQGSSINSKTSRRKKCQAANRGKLKTLHAAQNMYELVVTKCGSSALLWNVIQTNIRNVYQSLLNPVSLNLKCQ